MARLDGDPLVGEVKSRTSGSGFATLQRWLGSNDLLVGKQGRELPLVAMPWPTWRRGSYDMATDRMIPSWLPGIASRIGAFSIVTIASNSCC